jgi:hypothetical protein
LAGLPQDIVEACSHFSQGDLVEDAPSVLVADLRRPLTAASQKAAKAARDEGELGEEVLDVPCKFGIIVSQTCDIRSDVRLTIKVAPVYELPDPSAVQSPRRAARRTKTIEDVQKGRLVHKVMLNGPPGYLYADIEHITTVEKSVLLGKTRQFGFSEYEDYRQFAFRCGHVHDRPAVPDPADRVVNDLRAFLGRLREEDQALFQRINDVLAEECLYLDDWETPSVAQLWFFGHEPPPDDVREALDGWHANLAVSDTLAVLPNRYHAFSEVRAHEYRDLRVISYWYLSMEQEESS